MNRLQILKQLKFIKSVKGNRDLKPSLTLPTNDGYWEETQGLKCEGQLFLGKGDLKSEMKNPGRETVHKFEKCPVMVLSRHYFCVL